MIIDPSLRLVLLTGQPVDVSVYMDYHFWQLVITEDSNGKEILGRWCGPTFTQGDALTYQILCQDTGKLITRSNVRPAKNPVFPNRYIDNPNERPIIQIGSEDSEDFEPLFHLILSLGERMQWGLIQEMEYTCTGSPRNYIMFGINDLENGDLVDLKRLEMVSQFEFTNN